MTERTNPDVVAFNGEGYRGLTKREYFAAVALQGIMASAGTNGLVSWNLPDNANNAVKQADLLIRELNK